MTTLINTAHPSFGLKRRLAVPPVASWCLAALLGLVGLLAVPQFAYADADLIRKTIAQRLPNFPKIDEVTKTSVPGIWELRMGTEVLYTDAQGEHIFQGSIIETKTRNNLTQQRIDKLTAIDFASLPLADAMVVKQGNGARKVAVFADPNCGYCKRFERDLLNVKDVTVYTFLLPILGEDSIVKAEAIWCAKDAMKTWRAWMIDEKAPTKHMGRCNTEPLKRNLAFAQKFRITGTPAILFEDGKRVPGAMDATQIERALAEASKNKKRKT